MTSAGKTSVGTGNVNGTSRIPDNEQNALPVTGRFTEGVIICKGIIISTARGWTLDEILGMSGSRTRLLMCKDLLFLGH